VKKSHKNKHFFGKNLHVYMWLALKGLITPWVMCVLQNKHRMASAFMPYLSRKYLIQRDINYALIARPRSCNEHMGSICFAQWYQFCHRNGFQCRILLFSFEKCKNNVWISTFTQIQMLPMWKQINNLNAESLTIIRQVQLRGPLFIIARGHALYSFTMHILIHYSKLLLSTTICLIL